MILTCENCQTKFSFDATRLGANGRNVRCASCKHVWHVDPEPKADNEFERDVPELDFEPVTKTEPVIKRQTVAEKPVSAEPLIDENEKRPSKIFSPAFLKIAASVMIILNFMAFVFFNKEVIGQTSFYDMVGQYDTKAIEIVSNNITNVPAKGTNLQIMWVVKNTSSKTRKMPIAKFKLYDDKLEIVGIKTTPREKIKIPAGEELKFKDNLLHASKKTRYLTLEIGNGTELATR